MATIWQEVLQVKERHAADVDGDSKDQESCVDHLPLKIICLNMYVLVQY